MTSPTATEIRDADLLSLAQSLLDLGTLETRNRDSLDFHDHSVWSIKKALERAYEMGREMGR